MALWLRAIGFGVIFFGFGFVVYVALKPLLEKMPLYRKIKLMLLPYDFKESKGVKDEVRSELEFIDNEILRSKKNLKKKKVKVKEVNNGKSGTGVRGEEVKARKFYENKSNWNRKTKRRGWKFWERRRKGSSGGSCELTGK